MRKLSLVLMTAVMLWIVPVHALARAETPVLVLEGKESASAIVRLERKVVLSCCDFGELPGQEVRFGIKGFQVQTKGSYAGFIVERVRDGHVVMMAIRIPAMDLDDGVVATALTFERGSVLKPGVYRFHLVTDGASRIKVDARGLPDTLRLHPTAPTKVTASLVDLLTDGLPFGQERVAVDVDDRSMVGLLSHEEGENAQAHYQSHCLSAPGGHCGEVNDHDPHLSPGSGGGGGTIASVYRPGEVAAGSYEAVFTGGNVATSSEAHGFVIVFR